MDKQEQYNLKKSIYEKLYSANVAQLLEIYKLINNDCKEKAGEVWDALDGNDTKYRVLERELDILTSFLKDIAVEIANRLTQTS
jgi:hypothetical protein